MNEGQAKILKAMIRGAVEGLQEDLNAVFETIDDNAVPFELRAESTATPELGMIVHVFAVRADESGTSLFGDRGRVVEVNTSCYGPGSIVVEILQGPTRGVRFDVYPQQCLIERAKS